MDALYVLAKRIPGQSDEDRIEAAEDKGLVLEPVGPSDKAAVAIACVLQGLTALLVVLAWLSRNYKPIKAKKLVPVTFMYFAGAMWTLGSIATKCVINIVGAWSRCRVWVVWIRFSFNFIFLFLLIYRMYALRRIFILKKPCTGRKYNLPVLVACVFVLAFDLICYFIPKRMTVRYKKKMEYCKFTQPFVYGTTAIIWMIWAIFTTYIILIRNIKASFNEFRESLVIYFIGSLNIIVTLVFQLGFKKYTLLRSTRFISVTLDVLTATIPIWVLLAKPVFMGLFRHDEYLDEWKAKLVHDHLTKQYELQGGQRIISSQDCSKTNNDTYDMSTNLNIGEPTTMNSTTCTSRSLVCENAHPADMDSSTRKQEYPPVSLYIQNNSDISIFESMQSANRSTHNLV
ncbi:hypothetical protein GGI12_003849 [Dipsacomyces acuminosporus]|nr:hypothetical protein GGI12_003849 [Dipsacomyces acuminosporus]